MKSRKGFSLLELFLTLSMAVVLMTLVNSAFRFYAVEMDRSDEDMRQTMLAASVMQMIEDDLRGALHPEPLDTSALEELLARTAASLTGGQAPAGGDAGSSEESGDSTMESEEESLDALAATVAVLETPGLIGNQFQLQIDTSRLPRLEEYTVLLDANPAKLLDVPSDLKTVTYYVQEPGVAGIDDTVAGLTAEATGEASDAGGLVRRVLDRQAQNFAMVSGGMTSLQQTGDLLAPEVIAVEFSYWDGLVWQIEWNSDELGELPLAIKIQMQMSSDPANATALTLPSEETLRTFEHIIRLPMARVIEEETEDTTMEGI